MSLNLMHNFSKIVKQKLRNKYESKLQFFRVKPIAEIIYDYCHKTDTAIQYNDIKILANVEELELLKRTYLFENQQGKSQIYHRLNICGQYYAAKKGLMHEYPMMIITETKSIFIKRDRRFKKIFVGQGSSDETQSRVQSFFSLKSSEFLKSLDRCSIQSKYNKQNQFQDSMSFDSQVHDLFEEKDLSENSISKTSKKHQIFKDLTQNDLDHLIYYYQEPQTKQMKKLDTKNNKTKNTEDNISQLSNKYDEIKSNIIKVRPIEEIKSTRTKNSLLSTIFDLIEEKNFRKYSFGLPYENQPLEEFVKKYNTKQMGQSSIDNPIISNEHFKIENDIKDRANKRKKIRDKAEELLRKVKESDKIDSQNDGPSGRSN